MKEVQHSSKHPFLIHSGSKICCPLASMDFFFSFLSHLYPPWLSCSSVSNLATSLTLISSSSVFPHPSLQPSAYLCLFSSLKHSWHAELHSKRERSDLPQSLSNKAVVEISNLPAAEILAIASL